MWVLVFLSVGLPIARQSVVHAVVLPAADPIRDITDGRKKKTNPKQEYNLFNTQTLMQLAVLILRDAEVLEMSSL